MYERYAHIESIAGTLERLQQVAATDECYASSCERIRAQLQNAIAFETGHDISMSKYSSFYPDKTSN